MPNLQKRVNKEWGLLEIRAAGLRIAQDQNVIIGSKNIMRYTGIGSLKSLHIWVKDHGFPAILRPDGLWMTTVTAVDEWVYLCLMTQNANDYMKNHVPSSRALRLAKRVGLLPATIDVSCEGFGRNIYKREWEKRTGKNSTYYINKNKDREQSSGTKSHGTKPTESEALRTKLEIKEHRSKRNSLRWQKWREEQLSKADGHN